MMSEELTELAGTLKCLDAIDFKYVRTYASTQVKLTLMYIYVYNISMHTYMYVMR